MSAQKALRGSETETRELLGGTEENSASPIDLPYRQINEFSQKGNSKKLSWLPDLCETATASSLHLTSTPRPTPLLVEPREAAATGHCAGGHWQLALKQQLLGGGSLVLPGLLGQPVLFVSASLPATTRSDSCCLLLLLLLQFQRMKTRFSEKLGKSK